MSTLHRKKGREVELTWKAYRDCGSSLLDHHQEHKQTVCCKYPTVFGFRSWVHKEETITNFKTGRTPVHKMNSTLRFDSCNGGLNILRGDVSTIKQAACHCTLSVMDDPSKTRENGLYLPSLGSHFTWRPISWKNGVLSAKCLY
jgi:hypothetical protein